MINKERKRKREAAIKEHRVVDTTGRTIKTEQVEGTTREKEDMYECDFGGMAVVDFDTLTGKKFNGQKVKTNERDVEYFVAYKSKGLIEDEIADEVSQEDEVGTPHPQAQLKDEQNPEHDPYDTEYYEEYGTSDDEYGEIERKNKAAERKYQ